jgi:hypothetical protein
MEQAKSKTDMHLANTLTKMPKFRQACFPLSHSSQY